MNSTQQQDDEPTPVILISVDTLRSDRVTAAGYERNLTPNIDRFIEQDAYYFENTYANAPWTLPSHAAIFTGRYPSSTGAMTWNFSICEEEVTLAEKMNRSGYQTASFNGDAAISSKMGFDQGFERWEEKNWSLYRGNTVKAIEFLENTSERDFFLFVHGYDVHTPYVVPGSRPLKYGKNYTGPIPSTEDEIENLRANETYYQDILEGINTSRGSRHLNQLENMYDNSIFYADKSVGRLLEKLKEEELYDDSLVIVFSDHGEEFREHGQLGHSQFYDETMKVPLAVKFPHQEKGRKIERRAELIDIYSTVLEELGKEHSSRGIPLQRIIEGDSRHQNIFAERLQKKMVISNGHKLVWNFGYEEAIRYRLYNLERDEAEAHNLADNRTLLENINQTFQKYPLRTGGKCLSGLNMSADQDS